MSILCTILRKTPYLLLKQIKSVKMSKSGYFFREDFAWKMKE